MLTALILALSPAPQVETFPQSSAPSSPTRLGPQLVMRVTGGNPSSIRSVDEDSAIVEDVETGSLKGAGVQWMDRFAYLNSVTGLRASDGTGFGEAVFPPGTPDYPKLRNVRSAGKNLFVFSFPTNLLLNEPDRLLMTRSIGGPVVSVVVEHDFSQFVQSTAVLGDLLFFVLLPAPEPFVPTGQPWVSDGTEAGTFPLNGVRVPVSLASTIRPPVSDGEHIWFEGWSPEHGRELWVTDGTQAGTQMVADLLPGPLSSNVAEFAIFGDRIAFRAEVAGVQEVWSAPRSGGVPERLAGVPVPAQPVSSAGHEGEILDMLFVESLVPGADHVLWVSDGTPAGTGQLMTAEPLTDVVGPVTGVASDGTLLFRGRTAAHGAELFRTTGAPGSTSLIVDLEPGPASSFPGEFIPAGPRVYFTAGGTGGPQLRAIAASDLGLSSIQSVGTPCESVSQLAGTGLPGPGAALQLSLQGGAPGALGALCLGRQLLRYADVVPCGLRIEIDSVLNVLALDPTGAASLPLTVPMNTALVGLVFRLQFLEAQAGGAVQGSFAGSNVLEVVLGS